MQGTDVGGGVGGGVGDGLALVPRTRATEEWKIMKTRLCVANLHYCGCRE